MGNQNGKKRESRIVHELVGITISLMITTVLGALLGHYLQGRAWDHQHEQLLQEAEIQRDQQLRDAEIQRDQQLRDAEIQREQLLREAEIVAARNLFEELSTLMDRRLYRMRRLIWGYQTSASPEEMAERSASYREVLFEWNEKLSRNFVLAEAYFGKELRLDLEEGIAADFVTLHETLDAFKRAKSVDKGKAFSKNQSADILNSKISKCNSFMIKSIRNGEVGRLLKAGNELATEQQAQTDG